MSQRPDLVAVAAPLCKRGAEKRHISGLQSARPFNDNHSNAGYRPPSFNRKEARQAAEMLKVILERPR